MARLERFKVAQQSRTTGYEAALREIQAGRKRSHWIWYVLPQLAGLGSSTNAMEYGIGGREEARAYLADPELRARLLAVVSAIAEQLGTRELEDLMGSRIDAQKTVSSLTLFARIARQQGDSKEYEAITQVAEEVLSLAAAQGYPPCQRTLRALDQPE